MDIELRNKTYEAYERILSAAKQIVDSSSSEFGRHAIRLYPQYSNERRSVKSFMISALVVRTDDFKRKNWWEEQVLLPAPGRRNWGCDGTHMLFKLSVNKDGSKLSSCFRGFETKLDKNTGGYNGWADAVEYTKYDVRSDANHTLVDKEFFDIIGHEEEIINFIKIAVRSYDIIGQEVKRFTDITKELDEIKAEIEKKRKQALKDISNRYKAQWEKSTRNINLKLSTIEYEA